MSTKKKKKKKKKANTEKIKEKYIKEANSQTKSKGKKRSQNVNKERKNQRKKKSQHVGGQVQCEGTFGSSFHELPLSSFLSILGRKIFGRPEEKTPRPHNLLFFSLIQSNILQKSFSSHFLFKIFHSPYFTSKQTHPKAKAWVLILLGQNCHDDDTSQTNSTKLNPLDCVGF